MGELFIQEANQHNKYIVVGNEAFAPAIAIVFHNKFIDVSKEDSDVNANVFAAVPQLLTVFKFASEMANIRRSNDSDPKIFARLMEIKLLELEKITDAAKNKLRI